MKSIMKLLVTIASLFVMVNANADVYKDIRVQINDQKVVATPQVVYYYRQIKVTSMTDGLVITGVNVNRGQCRPVDDKHKGSYNVPFGSTMVYNYWLYNGLNNAQYDCNVVEIVVNTNKGQWIHRGGV